MNKRFSGISRLIFGDWFASALSWFVFFIIRKQYIYKLDFNQAIQQTKFIDYLIIFILVPVFWFILFLYTGSYVNIYKKSRLKTLFTTFFTTLIGSLILFFIFVLNDPNVDYTYFYRFIWQFFIVQFLFVSLVRTLILSYAKNEIANGKIKINTLIIGSNEKAIEIYNEITKNNRLAGNFCVGFLTATEGMPNGLKKFIPYLGNINEATEIVKKNKIEEVYIAVESTEHHALQNILLAFCNTEVIIKIDADIYDIMSGMVKTNNLFMSPFIEINPMLMQDWELILKRTIDIILSLFSITVLLPLYLYAAIKVKLSSSGPIFFLQERLGKNGKSFKIIKFRSMYIDAEKDGPKLSKKGDDRITPWGRIMRKWRIDETPQFINILKGDMSFVGPRPERKYFIDILSQAQPSYKLLLKVRPGITSWGMVKFGYAENTQEMLQRMKYDLLYLKNASIFLDFKIIVLTILVLLQGRGK